MTLEEYVDIIEHSDFEWGSGYGEDRCVGGDAYYTYNGITKPLIGYRERAWRSSKRDCSYPAGVMVFYERDGDTDYWRVKHMWARTKEEALVLMKEHVEYFMRYIKDIRSAEIRRCADAYER